MSLIKLIPINETFIRIECEDSVSKELSDYFTISIPNANKWKTKWNGKLKLFHFTTKRIYKGLIHYINEFALEHGHECDMNGLDIQNEISLFEVNQFVDAIGASYKLNDTTSHAIDLNRPGAPITAHKHQLNALIHALRVKRALILSPTASGKSLIIYYIIRSILLHTKKKILIIVPTINLVSQLFGDFAEYSLNNGWSTLANVHQIYQGQNKDSDKKVFISTWHSLYTQPKSYFEQFGCVIGDEAHLYSASAAKHILESCINAKYRFGLTGTLNDTKIHIFVLQGLFGKIYQPTTTKKLMDEKILSEIQIKCILLKHQPCEPMKYRDELTYLIMNRDRNKFIRNLAMSLNHNTLILYQFVEKHGEILYEMLKEVNTDNKKNLYFISGKVDKDVREQIRYVVEKQDNAIIVASYGTFSFGANIKNLHNIIFASPSKGRVRVCQSIGRKLRLHPTKKTAFLFDVADNLVYHTSQKNYTLEHFQTRLGIYHSEKFPYKTYHVELKE